MSSHPPERVARGIRVLPLPSPTLPPATHTNCWVLGEERLTVIDPASPDPAGQRHLLHTLQAWGTVERIVLTHHHHDHIQGALPLATALGVPILAHPETDARISFDTSPLLDGELLSTDTGDLRIHHTPGHAPGHLALATPTGEVVASDLIAGTGTIAIDPSDGGHLQTYLESLARIRRLEPTALLPAHGPIVPDGNVTLDHYIRHRHARTEQFIRALKSLGSSTALELARQVYTELDPTFHGLAAVQVLSHLIYLEEHQRAVRDGDQWSLIRT